MANQYEVPAWAGKPQVGLHLDVLKGEKMVQKLMIDEKKCYFFGRNPQLNDFCIDHASCSRVHSVLLWHKHLNRAFLVDLGSTHGTYIGTMRIESQKPTQLPLDSIFHFGASTRRYILRERPQNAPRPIMEELEKASEGNEKEGALLGLPESESELDNLTEFNTAHNRRIITLGIVADDLRAGRRKKKFVNFEEEDQIINPEDIDPSVGRFRNLVQTTVIPTKRVRIERPPSAGVFTSEPNRRVPNPLSELYDDLPPDFHSRTASSGLTTMAGHNNTYPHFAFPISTKLGMGLPNPAPDVEALQEVTAEANVGGMPLSQPIIADMSEEPKKKKYAKEAWPGKKSGPSTLLV